VQESSTAILTQQFNTLRRRNIGWIGIPLLYNLLQSATMLLPTGKVLADCLAQQARGGSGHTFIASFCTPRKDLE
jgi:hypothetical protein